MNSAPVPGTLPLQGEEDVRKVSRQAAPRPERAITWDWWNGSRFVLYSNLHAEQTLGEIRVERTDDKIFFQAGGRSRSVVDRPGEHIRVGVTKDATLFFCLGEERVLEVRLEPNRAKQLRLGKGLFSTAPLNQAPETPAPSGPR